MKYKYQLITNFKFCLTLLFTVMCNTFLFADGSKDLYPNGKLGYRAYLRSSIVKDSERWPFPTTGTHYVYAKEGERITLASSAQLGTGPSAIQLYSPSGALVVDDASANGQIPNREQEKMVQNDLMKIHQLNTPHLLFGSARRHGYLSRGIFSTRYSNSKYYNFSRCRLDTRFHCWYLCMGHIGA